MCDPTVVRGVELRVLVGELDAGDEEVVLLVAGVGSQDQPVDAVVLPLRPRHVGQPLGSQAGPLQGVGHYQVVEEGRVLLPDLVLLVDHPLLHRLIEGVASFFISHLWNNYSSQVGSYCAKSQKYLEIFHIQPCIATADGTQCQWCDGN